MNKKIYNDQIQSIFNQIINYNQHNISNDLRNIIENIFKEGEQGQEKLLNILITRRIINHHDLITLDGLIFDYLITTNIKQVQDKLTYSFPKGIVPLEASLQINYQPLQKLLINKKFQEANIITQEYLCQLAGLKENNQRKWLYFTDIALIPSDDLFIIDLLWRIYSQGKFGFSVQRKIWILNNYNWDKLWNKIGWIDQKMMRRYPQEFIWNIKAPAGHLPLFNQLRGNQVIASLFKHIVWQQTVDII